MRLANGARYWSCHRCPLDPTFPMKLSFQRRFCLNDRWGTTATRVCQTMPSRRPSISLRRGGNRPFSLGSKAREGAARRVGPSAFTVMAVAWGDRCWPRVLKISKPAGSTVSAIRSSGRYEGGRYTVDVVQDAPFTARCRHPPVHDVARHGASLGEASFAEGVDHTLAILHARGR